jgi:type I restriction enzyme M protein
MTYLTDGAKSALSGASEMLRSAIGSNEAWEYLIPLLFLKTLAEVSDDLGDNRAFSDLYLDNMEFDLGCRINSVLKDVEQRNIDTLANVFDGFDYESNRLGRNHDREILLSGLLRQVEKITCVKKPSTDDWKAECSGLFTEILEEFAKTRQIAEFVTPSSIGELIALLVDPKSNETIYDPVFGSAGLLSACFRYVKRKERGVCSLAGQEKNWLAWSIAKMSLYLQGADSSNLCLGDTIRSPRLLGPSDSLATFDAVVCNHPWGLKDWGIEEVEFDRFNRFSFGLPPRSNGEYAFILHALASMKKETGRVIAIVSNGALSRGGSEKAIRQKMVEANLVDAVISLPPKVFYNKDTAASLLILRAKKSDESILFIDGEKYFSSTRDRNLLSQQGSLKIAEKFHLRKEENTVSKIIGPDEIAKNDYDLHVGIYVHPNLEVQKIDLFALEQERIKVESELRSVEHELAMLLKKLGETYDT